METLLPIAIIKKRRGPIKIVRDGRGFSYSELSKVGISLDIARKTGLRIDMRRKSTNEENITMLKEWFEKMDKSTLKKMKSKPKRNIMKSGDKQRSRALRGLTSAGKKGRGYRKSRGVSGPFRHRLEKKRKI